MKRLFLLKLCLLVGLLLTGAGCAWGQSNVTLWEENWSGTTANNAPTTCTIEGYSDITYSYTKGNADCKTYAKSSFTDPELLISYNGGAFTATIPSSILKKAGADLTLKFDCNRNLTLTVTNGTLGTKTTSSSTYTYPVTVTDNSQALVIEFKNTLTSKSNARFSNVTLTGVGNEEVKKHTVTFYVNGVKHSDAEVAEGADITFPTGLSDITGYSFTGSWVPAAISGTVPSKPGNAVSTAKMGTDDVTYHAVYAKSTAGAGGEYTLDYNAETNLQNTTLKYGSAVNYTATDGSEWVVKVSKQSGLQINYSRNSSIKVPTCPQAINTIEITANSKKVGFSAADWTGSGTPTYLAEGSTDAVQILDLNEKDVTEGYIIPVNGAGAAVITKIVVKYGTPATWSNYCTTIQSEDTPQTKLYIKTGGDDWHPYVYTWNGSEKYTGDWPSGSNTPGTQATTLETVYGVTWHTIVVPSDNFNAILTNGVGQQTENMGPFTQDTYLVYNSESADGIKANEYLIVDPTATPVSAADVETCEGKTADADIQNSNNLTLTYSSDDTNVATIDETTGVVTGVAAGSTSITVSWKTQGADGKVNGNGFLAGSTTFTVTVGALPSAPTFRPVDGTKLAAGSQVTIKSEGATKISYTYNGNTFETEGSEAKQTVSAKGLQTLTAKGINKWGESVETSATYNVVDRPEDPTIKPSTVFGNTFEVTITTTQDDVELYYTTDGTTPDKSKLGSTTTLYTTPFSISNTTTVKAIAYWAESNVTSGNPVTATYTHYDAATSSSGDGYVLVTDASELVDGSEIIFVNKAGDKVMSTFKTNNFTASTDISFQDEAKTIAIPGEGATIWYLSEVSAEDGTFLIYNTETKCLYAAGTKSGANYLRQKDWSDAENDASAHATFSITENGIATVKFNTEDGISNIMGYFTSGDTGFGCYTSTSSANQIKIYQRQDVNIQAVNLKEGVDNTVSSASNVNVNLYRSLTANVWNSICLPFSLNETQATKLFGTGYNLQTLSDVDTTDGKMEINFTQTTTLEAGKPYMVKPTQNVQTDAVVVFEGVDIDASTAELTQTQGNVSFIGIYEPTGFTANDATIRFLGVDGEGNSVLYYPSNTNKLKAFRAYFKIAQPQAVSQMSIHFDGEDSTTTGISSITPSASSARQGNGVYTLDGRKVASDVQGSILNNLPKGIYIQNGKKFVVK